MAREIIFDMLNPYPTPVEFYKHELDGDVVYVYFTKNSVPFSVNIDEQGGDYTAVVAITIDDIIITEELQPTGVYNAGRDIYGIGLDFSDYDLFAGLMKVEFKISPNASPTTNYVPIIPLMINITPSILDNASATPESIGSVADMLRLYPDLESLANVSDELVAEVDGSHNLGSITKATFDNLDLTVGVVYTAGLTQGFLYTNSPGQSAMIIAVASDYTIIISALDGVFYVYGAAGARGDCEGATGSNSIQNGAVKSSKIPNYTVGFSQLTQGLQDTINEHTMKISALEETVGTLNTQLENALNGVT